MAWRAFFPIRLRTPSKFPALTGKRYLPLVTPEQVEAVTIRLESHVGRQFSE